MEQKKEEEKSLVGLIFDLKKIVRQFQARKFLQIEDNPKKFLFYNFLLGAARGLGFAIGISLIFALIVWLLSKLAVVPILGNFIGDLLDYLEKTRVY